MKFVLAAALVLTSHCQTAVTAEKQESRPVEARLLADVASVRPGQTFTAGVLLTMKPEWHVYWKNPGDSGLPVSIALSGPNGVTFGEMRWPLPVDFVQPGEIVGYGYTDTVLFPIEVSVPASVAPGAALDLAAEVSWLACKDVCIPGRAKLDLRVPVAAESATANEALFEQWRQRLPLDAGAASDLAGAKSDISFAPGASRGAVRLTLDWRTKPTRVEFYPGIDPALSIENVKVGEENGRTVIGFDAEIFEGQALSSDALETLVVYTDRNGARRGIEIPVRLRATDTHQKGAER